MRAGAAKAARRAASWAALAAAGVPAWLILKYGVDVPHWDQWSIAHFFEKLARGSLTLSDLYAQQNEYRQFFPNLIFVSLGWLTRWNVKYEMLVSLLLACLVAFNVRRLGARTTDDPFPRGVLFLLASLLIFSPSQYANWLFGVQVVYFLPVACVTSGLVVAYSEKIGTRAALLACACLSAVSTFSSANGLLCWFVLPPTFFIARPAARQSARRWLPLWAAGLALCAVAYAYGYRSPAYHPSTSEALRRPAEALAYFAAVLGGPLAMGRRPLVVGVGVGACALAAYAFACAYLFAHRGDRALLGRAAAWVALGAYSLGTAAMITVGRVGFGLSQSLSTRYTTFSLYLLLALVYLLPCVLEDADRRGYLAAGRGALMKRLAAAAAVVLVLAHVALFVLVVRHGAGSWRRTMLRAKACLLFIEVVTEERCIAEGLFPDVRVVRERAAALNGLGYLRPPLIEGGSMRDWAAGGSCSDDYGSFDLLPADGGEYVVGGRARLPHRGGPADAVVLAYGRGEDDQTAFALAEVGAPGLRDDARWRKTFSAAALPALPQAELTAWAFDAEKGKAYKLCGSHTLRRSE